MHRKPNKQFPQSGNKDGQPTIYRRQRVLDAVAAGSTVYLVEGQKDVHALESVGLVATTSPMGAGKWSKVDPSPLTGATVVLVADNDEPGRKHAAEVKASLDRLGATVTVVTARTGKDAADHIAAGHGPDEFVPLTAGGTGPVLDVITAADVRERRVVYLWEGRIPLGAVTLLPGRKASARPPSVSG